MANYTELHYHLIWATKLREPLITAALEPELYGYIRGKCSELNAVVHALNGVNDHVHLVCSVPASIAVAEFLHQVKGASGHFANRWLGTTGSFWQSGYGALTCSRRNLPRVVDYVQRQKEHHRQGTTVPELEQSGDH